MHFNKLTGTIPDSFWTASTALFNFNVGDNMMYGTIGTELGLMTDLKGLHLFENEFSGTIPTEIGNLRFVGTFGYSLSTK